MRPNESKLSQEKEKDRGVLWLSSVAGCTRGDTNDNDTTVTELLRSRLSSVVIVGY